MFTDCEAYGPFCVFLRYIITKILAHITERTEQVDQFNCPECNIFY